jgi:hypothetical protein
MSGKIDRQIDNSGLPRSGNTPFLPSVTKDRRGDLVIEKAEVCYGPKKGKRGYVDSQGRIWIKDRSHAGQPDHWDVQIDGGQDYIRVDMQGNKLA